MPEHLAAADQDELLILATGKVRLHGIGFTRIFVVSGCPALQATTVAVHAYFFNWYGIYLRENKSAHRRNFKTVKQLAYALFAAQFGDTHLDELRHVHITLFRHSQLAHGLHANSVRQQINMFNSMVNIAFKHLDIDQLSLFRRLYIRVRVSCRATWRP
jgi:hypothetical protein